MDISPELKGLPWLNKVHLLTYLIKPKSDLTNQTEHYIRQSEQLVLTESFKLGLRDAFADAS